MKDVDTSLLGGGMLKRLQALMLPKEIANLQEIAQGNEEPLPTTYQKSHMAMRFNDIVQHDLPFLWGGMFMLLIDEFIRWESNSRRENIYAV